MWSFFDNLLTVYSINNILKSTVALGFMLIVAQLSLKKEMSPNFWVAWKNELFLAY